MFPFDDMAAAIAGLGIIVLGYVVFGISGFGASLITIPVLSHFYPVPFVLVLAALLDLGSALVIGVGSRRDADVGEVKWLVPFSLAGAIVGVGLLVSLPRAATLLALGIFIAGYGVYGLLERGRRRRLGKAWAPLAGAVGGATGSLFGMGGPPYLIYLTRRIDDTSRLRATMSLMVIFSLAMRLVVFAGAGVLLQPELARALIWFVPAAVLGLYIGNHVHVRASNQALLRILYLVLVVSGSSLIVRALVPA